MGIKNRLLDIRLKMGYKKQKDFAEFLNISQYQYNRYENNTNQPSVELLYDISKKLNMHMDEILYREDPE